MTSGTESLPKALIRVSVQIPFHLPDGSIAPARAYAFDGFGDGREHVAFGFGGGETTASPLIRLHSECLTGDVFGSQRCDCGPQLHESLRRLTKEGGFLFYLRQEGRDIGLATNPAADAATPPPPASRGRRVRRAVQVRCLLAGHRAEHSVEHLQQMVIDHVAEPPSFEPK